MADRPNYEKFGYVGVIAQCLEKHLGVLELDWCLRYFIREDFYLKAAIQLSKISGSNPSSSYFWDEGAAGKNLAKAKSHWLEFRTHFEELTPSLKYWIESRAKRIKQHQDANQNFGAPPVYDEPFPISFRIEEISKLFGFEEDENSFEVALRFNTPLIDIRENKSREKLDKVYTVGLLRGIWKISKQQEAPNSIPYEGSAFGDFVSEIFTLIDMHGEPRAAMDAWRQTGKVEPIVDTGILPINPNIHV